VPTYAEQYQSPSDIEPAGFAIRNHVRRQSASVPLWFVAAIAPMLVSEIVRLSQTDPFTWIAYDYAGRIIALTVLAAVPAARSVAFVHQEIRIPWWEVAFWIIGLVAFDSVVDHGISDHINALFPGTQLGQYPSAHGWLFVIDTFLGLALVAYSEEVIFRRCAFEVLNGLVGDKSAMVVITAALFTSYHWWTGAGNIVATMLFGVVAMLLYRRAGALLPVVLAHYLCDVFNFSGAAQMLSSGWAQ